MTATEERLFKFSTVDASDPYDDRWSVQRTSGPERLAIAPKRGRHVDIVLDLIRCLREPFGVLYVLLLSRNRDHQEGRYQSPDPASRAETEKFVQRFRDYFESDGRHHIWFRSLPDAATVVYDSHDLIYAYGPIDRYQSALSARGFRDGPVAIPSPHQHRYHARFDEAEREVMRYWKWRHSPLQPSDDP